MTSLLKSGFAIFIASNGFEIALLLVVNIFFKWDILQVDKKVKCKDM